MCERAREGVRERGNEGAREGGSEGAREGGVKRVCSWCNTKL